MSHAKANEAHFDAHAPSLVDSEEIAVIGQQSTKAFLDALTSLNVDKADKDVLDFACGLGNISVLLAPHFKSILGVDISTGMVEQYNALAKKEGLDDKISAVRVDIAEDTSPLEGKSFDVIVCSVAFHHLTSPHHITSILASFLKPSGYLLVTDAMAGSEPIPKEFKHLTPHNSFSEEDMRDIYKAGGLEMKIYEFAFVMKFREFIRNCFIGVGQKKAE